MQDSNYTDKVTIQKEVIDSNTIKHNTTKLVYTSDYTLAQKLQFHKRLDTDNHFVFLVLILAIVLLLIPKLIYKGIVVEFSQSILSFGKFRLWLRDIDSLLRRAFLFSIPAYLLVLAFSVDIFVQQISFGSYLFFFPNYLLIVLFLSIYYLVRYVIIKFSSFIFQTSEIIPEYLSNIHLINTGLSIMLIPFVIMSISTQNVIINYILFSVLIFFEFIRVSRGFIIAMSFKPYNLFYFFLYFCTSEILPLILMIFWKVF